MSSSTYFFTNSDSADSAPQTPPHDFVHNDVTVASSDVGGTRPIDFDNLDLPRSSYTDTPQFGLDIMGIHKENRDNVFDPLLLAALAAASGPHTTRHHYHHHYSYSNHPHEVDTNDSVWDTSVNNSEDEDSVGLVKFNGRHGPRAAYIAASHAKETSTDLKDVQNFEESHFPSSTVPSSGAITPELVSSRSLSDSGYLSDLEIIKVAPSTQKAPLQASENVKVEEAFDSLGAVSGNVNVEPVEVRCMARARIPTPYGEAFLHLYHNSRDAKEHLAIVVDPMQLDPSENSDSIRASHIRSKSLDAAWPGETDADRITRGAYVGRLSAQTCHAFVPQPRFNNSVVNSLNDQGSYSIPAPLVRIHSECFTGETIGSLRCDCGEQLDEALRLIFQPIEQNILGGNDNSKAQTIPGRGAIIYMRQEGRGIGLLEKLRAYNLQDLGHDTVAANLLLGRGADERKYDIAGAILKDLGLADDQGEGIRLLTNNPDKVAALESEGVHVVERVPMIPRSWQSKLETTSPYAHVHDVLHGFPASTAEGVAMTGGATQVGTNLVGATVVRGTDLDKYLRTKVIKMGHMLSLPHSL